MKNLLSTKDKLRQLSRNCTNFGVETLFERGVRLKDKMVVCPVHGKKRYVSLNRVKYIFQSSDAFQLEVHDININLPTTAGNDFSFTLLLCASNKQKSDDSSSRYVLKANSFVPFRINGTFSYESYIERGDRVDIAYNRISFIDSSENKTGVFSDDLYVDNKLLQSDLSVLIEGETGTGKSRLARKIHDQSGRLGDFVHINIASFSPNLIESELFGHVKGAFTGAIGNKRGAFLLAHRGTLFLDEIDSLSLELQTKLLLFLDSKEIRPVGSDRAEQTDVRIIFASGRKLEEMVEQRKMRKDLFYRITSGIMLQLDTLRQRPCLIKQICEEIAYKKDIIISNKLIDFYKSLSWPGNVRQLLGHLNKKIIMAEGKKLEFDHEDEKLIQQIKKREISDQNENFYTLDQLKSHYAYKTYLYFDQNLKKSAEVLGITCNTLKTCLKKNESYIAMTSVI